MALLFANHSVTVYAAEETADPVTKVVPVPTEADGVDLAVQIEPVRNEVLIDAQTGAELINPYRMFVEPEDVGSVPYGARVVWHDTGYQFRITKKAMLLAGGGEVENLNHALSEMEQLEVEQE